MPTESLNLPIPTFKNISVRGKGKVRVIDTGRYYQVKALQTGQVILSSGKNIFLIMVYAPEQYVFVKKLERLVAGMRKLKITFSKDGPIIKGVLLHIADLLQLSELAMKHEQDFQLQALMDTDAYQDLQLHFRQFEHNNNAPAIQLVKEKTLYYLSVAGEDTAINAYHKRYLASFGLQVVYSKPKVALEPMIEIQMHVTEIRRSGFQRLGLQWASVYQATVLPQFVGTQIDVALNALEESGDSQTLAKPKLLCKSGGEAQFLAGGEIPIRIVGFMNKTRGVIWKTYGVQLSFQPVADKSGQMTIHLETEISAIDSGQTVDGIPAFFTNKVTSDFNLSSSKTIALSGLTTHFQGRSGEGLPFLKRLPILGRLFSSKDYRTNQTELLIFVTPKTIYEQTQQGDL